jgi:hypothetical protein
MSNHAKVEGKISKSCEWGGYAALKGQVKKVRKCRSKKTNTRHIYANFI